jgi:hypothetical protein
MVVRSGQCKALPGIIIPSAYALIVRKMVESSCRSIRDRLPVNLGTGRRSLLIEFKEHYDAEH